jgi:hypothetical protein
LGVAASKGTHQLAKKPTYSGLTGADRVGLCGVVAAGARRCSNTKVGKFRRIFNVEPPPVDKAVELRGGEGQS